MQFKAKAKNVIFLYNSRSSRRCCSVMSGMANLVGNGTVVDVRELSFQNVVDQILKPNGVKVGGFPDELFECLTDDEQSEYLCNIW